MDEEVKISDKKPKKIRLDKYITGLGLVETRSKAQALIIAGQVLVNDVPSTKSGELIKTTDKVSIKERNPYVSRGGLKLKGALDFFNIDVNNKICMDIGASTGGFTDCMLQSGAKKVYAIDAGKNQIDYNLKKDPKVISYENANFRYFSLQNLKEDIEFVTIDVSFISLEKILPVLVKMIKAGTEVVALVKPQFEVSREMLKKGVVRDEIIFSNFFRTKNI